MTMDHRLDRLLARFPLLATGAYLVLVLALLGGAWFAAADLLDRRQAVAQAEELLAQLDRGRPTAAMPVAEQGGRWRRKARRSSKDRR